MKQLSSPSSAHYPLRVYVERLLDLFHQAMASPDPALFLFKNDARTPLFMAEALIRLLNAVEKNEKTAKALKLFKKLEDKLGIIDNYDQLAARFAKIKGVKKEQVYYFIQKGNTELDKLNKKLKEKDFYLQRFQEILLELDIDFNDTAFIEPLQSEIELELKRCLYFYTSFGGAPVSMEDQVHEIRRKLRWISIYAQCLQGVIALKPEPKKAAWEKEFITKRELASPYLKVIVRKNLDKHIFFHQSAFYALGFMIEELGAIKDKGMLLEAFAKMLEKTGTEGDAEAKAAKTMKLSYTMEGELKAAGILLDKFFIRYTIHEKLL